MKKAKKIVALLLAATMAFSLAACGKTADGGGSGNGGSETSTSKETTATKSGDYVKLIVWGNGSADTEDCNEVAEAINKITREKIGVEIELVRGQDAEQINLALTSGEPIDLMCYNNISGQFNTVVNNNWAYPLDDLLDKFGKEAKAFINPAAERSRVK